MGFIRNVFALIGLVALIAAGYGYTKINSTLAEYGLDVDRLSTLMDEMDPKAPEVYKPMIKRMLETMNTAEATVWKVPVANGLSVEDVEEAMRFVANEHNIKNVGELPLSKQVEAMTGEKQRYLNIFMFCDPLTAIKMIKHSDAYSAYLPCRIALLEDKIGKYWLYALDLDMMIWGGAPLPANLKEEAIKVRTILLDIMERGAKGEF
ncbi:MAG: hypothetical protein BMS9Abin15_0306 [Gammaproteobacteria bacterium]|nr:MAG: hypothetical protein BMS9Abin15_0306 [Gammaproteobacteria bacterium]